MRFFLLILTFQPFDFLQAQEISFNISRQDTIKLPSLHFKKTVALRLDGAVVLLDYQLWLKKLQNEKLWLKKEISVRERMIKKKIIRASHHRNLNFFSEGFWVLTLFTKPYTPNSRIQFGLSIH